MSKLTSSSKDSNTMMKRDHEITVKTWVPFIENKITLNGVTELVAIPQMKKVKDLAKSHLKGQEFKVDFEPKITEGMKSVQDWISGSNSPMLLIYPASDRISVKASCVLENLIPFNDKYSLQDFIGQLKVSNDKADKRHQEDLEKRDEQIRKSDEQIKKSDEQIKKLDQVVHQLREQNQLLKVNYQYQLLVRELVARAKRRIVTKCFPDSDYRNRIDLSANIQTILNNPSYRQRLTESDLSILQLDSGPLNIVAHPSIHSYKADLKRAIESWASPAQKPILREAFIDYFRSSREEYEDIQINELIDQIMDGQQPELNEL